MHLPREILKLIESKKWEASPDCSLQSELQAKYGWVGPVDLRHGPEFDDGGVINAAKDQSGELFGVYLTGEFVDQEKLNYLDGNKCLMIACNWDEEAICLDYRFNLDNPRVMASDYSQNRGRWVEIASSVNELIEKLGIRN